MTDNMRTHLDSEGKPACNNFTSMDIKLTSDTDCVSCNSCKLTIKYKQIRTIIKMGKRK